MTDEVKPDKIASASVSTGFRPLLESPEDELVEAFAKARQHAVVKETAYTMGIASTHKAFVDDLAIVAEKMKLSILTAIAMGEKPEDLEWLKKSHEFDAPVASPNTAMLLTNLGSAKRIKELKNPFEIKKGVRVSTPYGEFVTDTNCEMIDNQTSLWALCKRGDAPKLNYAHTVLIETVGDKKLYTIIEKVKEAK